VKSLDSRSIGTVSKGLRCRSDGTVKGDWAMFYKDIVPLEQVRYV
jgi:hypothetical protein